MKPITVETTVRATLERVWEYWNTPEHIERWLHASEDWECSAALNDVRVGGRLTSVLSAKDKSASFEFGGTYTAVEENRYLAYTLDDGRAVTVTFTPTEEGVRIVETFEPENENPEALQREGWQSILDSFKAYTEA